MKLYKEILLNTDSYSNPFKLPDGLIKNIFQLISEYSTPIIILCAIGILVSFCSLFSNKYSFLDKSFGTSSYSIAWISVFTVLAAFCLSVSFEDLGFTIFKTIVPTTAGFTALALLAQNDQKNRRESYERHKEYVRDNISNRRDRYSEAIEKIATEEKLKPWQDYVS